MKTRRVLTGLSGLLVAALMTTTANSQEFQLRFADQVPLTHVASAAGNQVFMERVQEALGDRVAFRHYPAEQLGRAASMLDIVQNRTADIAMVGVTYASDRLPLVGAIELPGLFDNVVDGQAAFDGLVRNELMESFEGAGLRPLWVMTTPPYQLMMRQAESIETVEDLAGKQLRVAGATSQLVAASLGASPATIPPADLYQSLERGVVDGALYTLAAMRAYNLQEVTESYTTNAKLGGIAFITFINLDTWNSLPADVQQVLDEVGSEVGVSLAEAIDEAQEATIDFLRGLDKNVYALSDEVSEALDERLRTVQQEWVRQMEQRGLPGSETLDAFLAHLAD